MLSFFPSWLQRAFLSLLCLVGSLAYITRESQGAYLAELFPAAQMQALEACGSHAAHGGPKPSSHNHDHSGHCPFCFWLAFALAAGGYLLRIPPKPLPCWRVWTRQRLWLRRLRRFVARAPPGTGLALPSQAPFFTRRTHHV